MWPAAPIMHPGLMKAEASGKYGTVAAVPSGAQAGDGVGVRGNGIGTYRDGFGHWVL
jgi:hypothetical protein